MPPHYKLSPAFIAMLLKDKSKASPPDQPWSEEPMRRRDPLSAMGSAEPDFTPLEDLLGERRTPGFAKPEAQRTLPTIGNASPAVNSPSMAGPRAPQFAPLEDILGGRPTPVYPPAPVKPEPQLNLPTIGDVWQRMQADKRRTAAAYGPSDEWEPERDVIFPPLPGYPPRDGLLGRVGADTNGASMRRIDPNPEQPISFGVTRPTPTPFVERPGIGSGLATDDNRTKAAMSAQVDPQFHADHEGFRQLIGDGRLNPAEQQRVGAIIDRVNAYRLGSQQGPVGDDAHSAAASDLGRVAGRLAQQSPRVAAPLAAYAMVHDQAAQRRADPGGAASMTSYGDASGQTAPAVNTAPARGPYDFSSGFPSGRYDELSALGDLVPDAWSRGPAQRHVFGQGTQFAANQKAQAKPPFVDMITKADYNPNAGPLTKYGYVPGPDDALMLARMIFSEGTATPEDHEAIGWSIVNRVGNPSFRPTLHAVLTQPQQYQIVPSGGAKKGGSDMWRKSANPSKMTGANLASWNKAVATARGILTGKIPDPTGGATYFFASRIFDGQAKNAEGGFKSMIGTGSVIPSIYTTKTNNLKKNYYFNEVSWQLRPKLKIQKGNKR